MVSVTDATGKVHLEIRLSRGKAIKFAILEYCHNLQIMLKITVSHLPIDF